MSGWEDWAWRRCGPRISGFRRRFTMKIRTKNIIELNVDNFTNLWAVTEGLKELPSQLHVFIDPEKLIAARKAGASPWDVHVRAFAGEFVPAKPYDLGRSY